MRKTRTVVATTGALLALTAPAAMAVGFSGSMPGSQVSGHVAISPSTASITGTVRDTAADGKCATLRGNWDVPLRPDHGFDVARACGNGTQQSGSNSDNVDRSARDFEVRTRTGDDYKVVWQGTNDDA